MIWTTKETAHNRLLSARFAEAGVDAASVHKVAHVDQEASMLDLVRSGVGLSLVSRFAQLHDLENAFAKRAIAERAKGILIERHSISELSALGMLRERAQLDRVVARVGARHARTPSFSVRRSRSARSA